MNTMISEKRTMRNTIILLACALLFLANPVFAQNEQDVSSINRVGTTAAQFLKIGAGARATALGGAYTAIATDITSIYWNPAGLARSYGNGEAIFNHAEWLAETDYDFAAFSLRLPTLGTVGLSITSFRTPDDPVRTIQAPEGTGQTWNMSSISAGITYSRNLTDKFSIGFTGKFVQERLFNLTARGGAFDIGILYDTPLENVTLGATITNFGTKMRLEGRDLFFNNDPFNEDGSVDAVAAEYRTNDFEMPLNLKFGLAWQAVKNDQYEVLATVDANQPNDNIEYLNSGVEVGIKSTVFLRAGYKALGLENSEQGATFGVGINYDNVGGNFKFDFGWADYGVLKNVKFVSFIVKY